MMSHARGEAADSVVMSPQFASLSRTVLVLRLLSAPGPCFCWWPGTEDVTSLTGDIRVAGVAVAQLLGRDAVLVRFPTGSGWSVQALLDPRVSLDTWALVRV